MRACDVSDDLLRRLAVPGPRYTSYPPANMWGDLAALDYDVALGAAAAATARAGAADLPASLYVHVPFCRLRCAYCGLNVSGARDPRVHARYVDAVVAEAVAVQARAGGRLRAVEVAWGGGTPTSLEAAELARLAAGVTAAIPLLPGARLSVEVDPRVTTPDKLRALAAAGFRRVSLGVQDLDPEVQAAAGRVQGEEESRRCLEAARDAGFEGANVDLMYGLPRQNTAELRRTVERVLAWAPERVTLFGYAHLPARFPNQRRIAAADLPGPRARLDLLLEAAATLGAHGYRWLGLDHFVREDDELWRAHRAGTLGRNFMGYVPARAATMVGLGASSIGEVHGTFVQNEREVGPYEARVASGGLATARGYRLRGDDALRADVIERLMCDLAVDLAATGVRHGVDGETYFARALTELRPLAALGLVEVSGARVQVTPLGRLFLRNVCMAFDGHRGSGAQHASTV
jgi:oxygen-independent coproporphyrinogen-3 oxidase